MDIRLYSEQKFRVITGHKGNNFIDIKSGMCEQAIEVSFLVHQQYMEIRKKNGSICTYYFESKRHKRNHNFGWWEDAEVIFANNDVEHE